MVAAGSAPPSLGLSAALALRPGVTCPPTCTMPIVNSTQPRPGCGGRASPRSCLSALGRILREARPGHDARASRRAWTAFATGPPWPTDLSGQPRHWAGLHPPVRAGQGGAVEGGASGLPAVGGETGAMPEEGESGMGAAMGGSVGCGREGGVSMNSAPYKIDFSSAATMPFRWPFSCRFWQPCIPKGPSLALLSPNLAGRFWLSIRSATKVRLRWPFFAKDGSGYTRKVPSLGRFVSCRAAAG